MEKKWISSKIEKNPGMIMDCDTKVPEPGLCPNASIYIGNVCDVRCVCGYPLWDLVFKLPLRTDGFTWLFFHNQ